MTTTATATKNLPAYGETKTRRQLRPSTDTTILYMKNVGSPIQVWVRITPSDARYGQDCTHYFTRPNLAWTSVDEGWELDHSTPGVLSWQDARDTGEFLLAVAALDA